jgi:hypothetical protein
LSFISRFINLFYGLKRENYVTDVVGFAVPHQLHLFLVFKQQKPVFIWQRLVLCQITVDFLEFL